MDQQAALRIAITRYGQCVASTTAAGDCVISVYNNGNYEPLGYGSTWEDALIDCVRQANCFEDCAYA